MIQNYRKKIYGLSVRKKLAIPIIMYSIIIFAIVLFLLFKTYDRFKTQFEYDMQKCFQLTYVNLNNKFNNYHYASYIIESEESVNYLIQNDIDFSNSNTIIDDFNRYNKFSSVCENVKYYYNIDDIALYSSLGNIYTATGRQEFSKDLLEKAKWHKNISLQKRIMSLYNHTYFTEDEQCSAKYLQLIKPIYSSSDFSERIGFIRFPINKEDISKICENNLLTSNTSMLLLDSNGNSIDLFGKQFDPNIDLSDYESNKLICITIDNNKYFMIKNDFLNGSFTLCNITPYTDIVLAHKQFYLLMFIIFTLFNSITLFILLKVSNSISSRLSALSKQMSKSRNGCLEHAKTDFYSDDISVCIIAYNDMIDGLNKYMDIQIKNEKQIKKLELNILQEQINPHFLYNSFEMINSLSVRNNIPEISHLIQNLSTYYRLALNSGKTITTLENEITHIKSYIDIQNLRFECNIELFVDIPEHLLETKIIKLLLQPIVENSIYHGFCKSNYTVPSGNEITILAYDTAEYVFVEITDNGIGIEPDKLKTLLIDKDGKNYALYNINQRIRLSYDQTCGITINSELNKYTTVIIKIRPDISEN